MRFRKPAVCPKCGETEDLRFIVRGLLTERDIQLIQENKAVPGGCLMFADLPMWQCGSCRHELSDETDPAVIQQRIYDRRLLGDMRV